MLNVDVVILLVTRSHDVLLNHLNVDVSNLSLITIEDLGDLFKSGTTGLDVEDSDEDEFKEDPALVVVSKWYSEDQSVQNLQRR